MSDTIQFQELSLPVGQIKGALRKTIYDDSYFSLEGIPYGQPPMGELRFKAPLPAQSWTSIRDCLSYSTKPIQKSIETGEVEGSEDCLYLNVYSKSLQSDRPLPVMVWIYGGAFYFGEGTRYLYSLDYFMKEDVVVVTFNYRLCSLGFLSVEDPYLEIPGNAGLKDQVLALKWVKQYIQHFNGDPDNITLFGESAGGASTHFLTATHQTKGLFHKAICMSGTMLNPWSIIPPKDERLCLSFSQTSRIQLQDLTLPLGQIKGGLRKTIYDDNYFSFEGIPYGQPPVGELRFKAPLPAQPWTGIRNCLSFSTKPIQKNEVTGEVEGSEDCLYLNVYSKSLQSERPLPVMVWIYGGAFHMGEGTRNLYSPDYFMKEDVVVVTFNYRVCSLGFLSVEDPNLQIPGNAGLKDQVLALKWVKQYIQHFNGDPDNITLFGDSAGGGSTHFLTATQQTKGLFHKAICMSGTMLNPWSTTPPKDYAYRLAKHHGYEGENIDGLVVGFLRTLEPGKLVNHDILTSEDKRNDVSFTFGPCIEPYESENCVIPNEARVMLKSAWGNDIPIIFGGTPDEGLVLYPRFKMIPHLQKLFILDPERLVPYEVRLGNDKSTNLELAKVLLDNHFGDNNGDDSDLKDIINCFGIKTFWHGIHRSVVSRLSYATAPTYLYRFAFDSPTFNHHRTHYCGDDIKTGVSHADDISYLWFSNFSWKLDKKSKEYETISRMISIFVNFAKDGKPGIQRVQTDENGDGEALLWKPLEVKDPYVALNIGEQLEIKTLPEKKDILAWNSVYDNDKLY